jgi:hypothetical protein
MDGETLMADIIRRKKRRYKTYEEMNDYERNIYAHLGHQEIHRISDKDKKTSIRPKDTKKGTTVKTIDTGADKERRTSFRPKETPGKKPDYYHPDLDKFAKFTPYKTTKKFVPGEPKKEVTEKKKDTSIKDTAIGVGLALTPLAALLWKGHKGVKKVLPKLLSQREVLKRITHVKNPKQIKPSMLKLSEIKKITHEKAPNKLAELKKSLWNKAMETKLNKGVVAKGSEQGKIWRQYVKGGPKVFFTENYKYSPNSFEKAAKGAKVSGVNIKTSDVRIPKAPSSNKVFVQKDGKWIEKPISKDKLNTVAKDLKDKKINTKNLEASLRKILKIGKGQALRLSKGFLNSLKRGPLGLLLFAPEIKGKIERTIKETKEHKFKTGGYIGRKYGGRIGTSDGNEFVKNLYDD